MTHGPTVTVEPPCICLQTPGAPEQPRGLCCLPAGPNGVLQTQGVFYIGVFITLAPALLVLISLTALGGEEMEGSN